MAERSFNCPNCGAALKAALSHTKLVTCAYCDSSVFLDDEAVKLAGKRGVMADLPSILRLGGRFQYREWRFDVVGQARFDYANGYWDEFWVIVEGAAAEPGRWVSVDEGDIAVETPIEIGGAPDFKRLELGATLTLFDDRFIISELGRGTCNAVRGELPEALEVGQSFDYAHLRSGGARLITLEYDEMGVAASDGVWVDPFEIRPAR